MEIMIRCYGNVQQFVGSDRIELTVKSEATVSDALDRLVDEYSELEKITNDQHALVVMREGSHLDPSTELAEEDIVSISTPPMRD